MWTSSNYPLFNHCVNCNTEFPDTNSLTFEISIDLYPPENEQKQQVIKIDDALDSIYKLSYKSHQKKDFEDSNGNVQLCLPCAKVFENLLSNFYQFNQLRHIHSYLAREIEAVDEAIKQFKNWSSQQNNNNNNNHEPEESLERVQVSENVIKIIEEKKFDNGPWVILERLSPDKLLQNSVTKTSKVENVSDASNYSMSDNLSDDESLGEREDFEDQDFQPPRNSSPEPSTSSSEDNSDRTPTRPPTDQKRKKRRLKSPPLSDEDDSYFEATVSPRKKLKKKNTIMEKSKEPPQPSIIGKKKAKYTCKICFEDFRSWDKFAPHKLQHEKEFPFKCPQQNCLKRFPNEAALLKHSNQCEGILCKECERCFKNKTLLKSHMRVHRERGVICDYPECGRKVRNKSSLAVHQRAVHTLERPFICDASEECKATFASKGGLRHHKMVHHEPERTPLLCAECGKSYKNPRNLRIHMRVHSEETLYSCQICSKSFKHQHVYHHHLLIHNNLKPHLCVTCGLTFRQRHHLKRHEQVHSQARPYSCKICSLTFPDNRPLKKHLQTHDEATVNDLSASNILNNDQLPMNYNYPLYNDGG